MGPGLEIEERKVFRSARHDNIVIFDIFEPHFKHFVDGLVHEPYDVLVVGLKTNDPFFGQQTDIFLIRLINKTTRVVFNDVLNVLNRDFF